MRATPVARQVIIDSHGVTITTPRYRWDYRRPGAWLPLSMCDHGEPVFQAAVDRLWMAQGPRLKTDTWRGWWGTLQRTEAKDPEVDLTPD